MLHHSMTRAPRATRKALAVGVAVALAAPALVSAQQNSEELEEIIVTGSFIRNSDFTGASPVDTVDQETLLDYGAANIGQYLIEIQRPVARDF